MRRERRVREELVRRLGFLEAQNVRAPFIEQAERQWQS